MSKVEAILHLLRRGTITETKAYSLAISKKLSEEEINKLKKEIEIFKNPPVIEEDD